MNRSPGVAVWMMLAGCTGGATTGDEPPTAPSHALACDGERDLDGTLIEEREVDATPVLIEPRVIQGETT